MPLERLEVRNEYGQGAPEKYREANREDPKEILEGVAIAGLMGVLRQLGDLTDFAAEIFHGLQEELTMTSSRSRKLLGRVRRIEAALSPLEKAVSAQRSHLQFAYVPGSNWRACIDCERNSFAYTDVPQFILDSYEDCREPPQLHLLDRFDSSGPGSCFKRYSDPLYFKKASAGKRLEERKESKVNKLRSGQRNRGASTGASFSNPGGSMPLHLMSSCDATLRSDLSERVNLDFRNVSSSPSFRPSYTVQAMEKDDDHHTCVDSFSTKLDVEAKPSVQTRDQESKSEYIDICFDEYENEKDIFMDAPNAILLEEETDVNSTRNQDSEVAGEAAELRKQNSLRQTSYSESNGSFIVGGCEHNHIAVSLKSSFAALCCVSCISAKDLCNSVSPVDKSSLSHSHGGITHGMNTEYTTDKRSGLPQKPAPETSDGAAPVFVWTNGGLLGLQPSKPPDYGLGDDHGKPDKMKNSISIEESPNTNSSTYQEFEGSSWFRKIRCKISPDNFGIKLDKNDASLTQAENVLPDKNDASLTQAGNVLPVAAKKHAEDSTGSSRMFESDNRLLAFKQNDSITSPSSSPPLRHMKISFQPIGGFETSKLKLKFPSRFTGDESCSDIFPLFQLVPEVPIAQRHGGLDSSDDDTFCRSSASSLDSCCQDHQSESNSESGESPANNGPDLCSFLSRMSCSESILTGMENGSSHSDRNYMQSSHSCRSFDSQSMKAVHHSFQDDTRHDDLVESECATAPDPSSVPPVQWYGIKRNLDYAFNLNDSSSTITQQPKPAPLDNQIAIIEQKRKDSNGQRDVSKGKGIDEKEDFLQLIRSKSFHLRPTVTTKTSTPLASPANVHATAILKKANSIRQVVGSEDADDDGDWSDI